MKRAVIYFPYFPFPVRSGGQWRCVSIAKALAAKGYHVTLITAGRGCPHALEEARKYDIDELVSLPPWSLIQRARIKILGLLKIRIPPHGSSEDRVLISLLKYFKKRNPAPDLFVVNYSENAWIKGILNGKITILDTLDLISVSRRIHEYTLACLKDPRPPSPNEDPFLSLDFFKDQSFEPSDDEISGCRDFDAVMMIADDELAALKIADPSLPLHYVPPCTMVRSKAGDFAGDPIFASGPNAFNIQGLLNFQGKVLPTILQRAPDFGLTVTGSFIRDIEFHQAVDYKGVLADLQTAYQSAGFAVIPTFGGTGQQLKVVEAMGAGLAVVAYAQRVDSGIIENGVEGFLVQSEEEFAEKVLLLWRDKALRATMGAAAQRKIKSGYSQQVLDNTVSRLIDQLEAFRDTKSIGQS